MYKLRWSLSVLLAVILFWAGRLAAPQPQTTQVLVGETVFQVKVADTESSRSRGLSGQTLCPNCGLLFDFGQEQSNLEMWMPEMLIDLDMLWLNSAGVEVARAERVPKPACFDLDRCPPARRSTDQPARYVLELPAGTLQLLKDAPLSVTLGSLGP